jgi:hypothetical protein
MAEGSLTANSFSPKRSQEALIRRKGIKGLVTWGEKFMGGLSEEERRIEKR